MHRKILLMLIVFIVISSFICYAETQAPGLWPAIESIEEKDGEYIFNINTMVYCPEGVSGTLFVAAYDNDDKLIDITITENISVDAYAIENNCYHKEHLGQSFDAELVCKENDDLKIKAFLIESDTLSPKLGSGDIEYFYNDGNSYVDVSYVLESNHYNHTNGIFYYYYYYDGQCSKVDVTFDDNFYVGNPNSSSSFFRYFHEFNGSTGNHFDKELSGKTISYSGFSGVKLIWELREASDEILQRYGFKTENIIIWL